MSGARKYGTRRVTAAILRRADLQWRQWVKAIPLAHTLGWFDMWFWA
jgi:hypothetical protein